MKKKTNLMETMKMTRRGSGTDPAGSEEQDLMAVLAVEKAVAVLAVEEAVVVLAVGRRWVAEEEVRGQAWLLPRPES